MEPFSFGPFSWPCQTHAFETCPQQAVDAMRANAREEGTGDRGVVINVASMGGLLPMPFSPVYAATKHGVVGLCRSMEVLFPFLLLLLLVLFSDKFISWLVSMGDSCFLFYFYYYFML